MSNYRHSFSFIISSIIFTLIGFSFFLLAQKVEKPKRNLLSPIIKIAIITPPVKKVVEKKKIPPVIVAPIPIPHKVHKKIKHKKSIKRKIHKKKRVIKKKRIKKKIVKKRVAKKKIVKKRVIKKKFTKKRIVKKKIIKKRVIKPKEVEYKEAEYKRIEEPIIQEVYTPPIPQPKRVIRPIIKAPTPIKREAPAKPQRVDKSAEKQQFLSQVRSQIIANKRYPKMALRRHIQGTVKVRFDITANGDVSNIRYINGKSILQKGARRAIEKSFPIDIPNYLRSEFPINDISVSIHFHID